jgi:hypothetical protein
VRQQAKNLRAQLFRSRSNAKLGGTRSGVRIELGEYDWRQRASLLPG